jgi:APA family basic amino acid/polyamine antiporter
VLRVKAPEMPRPYRAPFSITVGRRQIALTALVGGLGTFAVWLVVIATHELARWVGIPWILAGIVLYYFYRRRRGLPLTKTVRVET